MLFGLRYGCFLTLRASFGHKHGVVAILFAFEQLFLVIFIVNFRTPKDGCENCMLTLGTSIKYKHAAASFFINAISGLLASSSGATRSLKRFSEFSDIPRLFISSAVCWGAASTLSLQRFRNEVGSFIGLMNTV